MHSSRRMPTVRTKIFELVYETGRAWFHMGEPFCWEERCVGCRPFDLPGGKTLEKVGPTLCTKPSLVSYYHSPRTFLLRRALDADRSIFRAGRFWRRWAQHFMYETEQGVYNKWIFLLRSKRERKRKRKRRKEGETSCMVVMESNGRYHTRLLGSYDCCHVTSRNIDVTAISFSSIRLFE